MGFKVSVFRVKALGFRALGFRALGFRSWGSGFRRVTDGLKGKVREGGACEMSPNIMALIQRVLRITFIPPFEPSEGDV